jgi:hypothetical protein
MRNGGITDPAVVQRIEGGLIAALSVVGTIVIAPSLWWMPLALFLVFDLSQLAYLRSPAAGAAWYNAFHTYAWAAVLGIVALVVINVAPVLSTWCGIIALAWAFHAGIDRALGYGLKLPDAFTHTHLGWIGKDRKTHGHR